MKSELQKMNERLSLTHVVNETGLGERREKKLVSRFGPNYIRVPRLLHFWLLRSQELRPLQPSRLLRRLWYD